MRIPKETLTELIRSNVIHEIFYPKHNREPQLRFSIHAIALEPIINQLELKINGQTLIEKPDKKVSVEFIWPEKNHENKTSLSIQNLSGETFSISEYGVWGLFRLINQGNIVVLDNSSENYQLLFNINGHSAKFFLSANTPLNPFIPGILNNLNLPEHLFS